MYFYRAFLLAVPLCVCVRKIERIMCEREGGWSGVGWGGEVGLLSWVISSPELQTLAHTLHCTTSSTPLAQSEC